MREISLFPHSAGPAPRVAGSFLSLSRLMPLRLGGGALLAAFALTLAGPVPAAAQGLDGSVNIFDSAMQMLGLKEEEEKPEIDYRERAPLVVPPRVPDALPPPQKSAAESHPNWPKDYDQQRRAAAAQAAKQPIVRDDPGKPLMPSELNRGKKRAVGNSTAPTEPVGAGSTRDVLMPSQLGSTNWLGLGGKQEQLTFNGEPNRENLIQPPPGYQTPAPNAPYGVVEDKKEPWKMPSLFDRQ